MYRYGVSMKKIDNEDVPQNSDELRNYVQQLNKCPRICGTQFLKLECPDYLGTSSKGRS